MIFDFPCKVEIYNEKTRKFEHFGKYTTYRKALRAIREQQEIDPIPFRIC